jgi:hypothetical protein
MGGGAGEGRSGRENRKKGDQGRGRKSDGREERRGWTRREIRGGRVYETRDTYNTNNWSSNIEMPPM